MAARILREYQYRPCIDHQDQESPSLLSNYYDVCPLIDRFIEYTNKKGNAVDYAKTEEKNEDSFDLLSIFDSWGSKKGDMEAGQSTTSTPNTDASSTSPFTTTTTTVYP